MPQLSMAFLQISCMKVNHCIVHIGPFHILAFQTAQLLAYLLKIKDKGKGVPRSLLC